MKLQNVEAGEVVVAMVVAVAVAVLEASNQGFSIKMADADITLHTH